MSLSVMYHLCRNGDHIHTNFRDMYLHLRFNGYFIEVLGMFYFFQLYVCSLSISFKFYAIFVIYVATFLLIFCPIAYIRKWLVVCMEQ